MTQDDAALMQNLGPNGDGKSAVSTPDGRNGKLFSSCLKCRYIRGVHCYIGKVHLMYIDVLFL